MAERLPEGERVLWEGAPRRALVARHVLYVRLVAGYFALTAGWWAVRTAPELGLARALPMLAGQVLLGLLVVGMLYGYAAMTARGSAYVITTRRVILRVGAVFPVVVNLPLAQVASAGVHRFRDGSAQIALQLAPGVRASWWLLWPHARPTRLRWPEPLLRGLAGEDARAAAAALQEAVAALEPADVGPHAATPAGGATRPADPSPRLVAAGTPLAAA
jgi:hypothetical protein